MKTRTGFVSNSSSSSFVVFATEESIVDALTTMEKVHGKNWKRFLKDEFVSGREPVYFMDKEFFRNVGTTYTENWEVSGYQDSVEDEAWPIIKQFFKLIGPVSKIEEY